MIIFRQSMKRILQNKIRFLILLIMPGLFIAMFALMDERSLTIGIVDKDNSTLSQRLIKNLGSLDKVKVMAVEEDTIYDRAVSFQTDYTLVLEPGFEEKLIRGKNPEVKEFYLDEKEKLFYAKSFTETFIHDMRLMAAGANFSRDAFFNILKAYDDSRVSVKNLENSDTTAPNTRAAMGFLVQFMLYMSVITAGLLAEDKNNGVFYRTFYGPVTLKRYMAENLAAFLTIGIAQVTMIFLLIKLVFGLDLGASPLSLYALYVAFSLVCVSLGMWLVSMFKKPIGAYTAILLLTTPLVMLGGCYWPMSFMPDIFQKIGRFIPTTYVMEGVEKILFEGKGLAGISMQLLILLIFSGIFLAGGLVKKVDISK